MRKDSNGCQSAEFERGYIVVTQLNQSSPPSTEQSVSEIVRLGSTNLTKGLVITSIIMGVWAINLAFLLSLHGVAFQLWWVLPAIAVQTFLYTGLFIVAHDAMHRSLLPQNPRLNDWIGSVALTCYAFFSFKKLVKTHALHHRHPASDLDPDFSETWRRNSILWYFQFLKRYWSWTQVFLLLSAFHILNRVFGVSEVSLILFWIVPSLLSSAQLFYFGTFLPHHEPEEGYQNRHRAQSSTFSPFLSFITCYHFGYHEEHHEYPQLPWWRLPTAHRLRTAKQ